jgi:hypothetical protein
MRRGRSGLLAAALALFSIAGSAPAGAQDDPDASIEQDTLWRRADSPIVVRGIVTVEEGAVLSIEPGVRVETLGLRVLGGLRAQGTANDPIVFTGVDGSRWDGIAIEDVDGERPSSVIANAHVDNAIAGLSMRKDAFSVEGSLFTRNRTAVDVSNPAGAPAFTGNRFYSNRVAFTGKTTGVISIHGNDFWDNHVSLLFQAQNPYACSKEPGTFDVRHNDILRGPDAPYWSWDVRVSEGSYRSRMVVRAPENCWGTTDSQDIAARTRTQDGCCQTAPLLWDPPSTSPETPNEPPGPVGSPEYEPPYHGDPRSVVGVRTPRQRACLPERTLERIVGTVSGAVGPPPRRVDVALVRIDRTGPACHSYDAEAGRFSIPHACDDARPFSVPAPRGKWVVKLRRPLASGKYRLVAGGNDGSAVDVVRFRVLRS